MIRPVRYFTHAVAAAVLLSLMLFSQLDAWAQKSGGRAKKDPENAISKGETESKRVVRVYPVDDLLLTFHDYPFHPSLSPFDVRETPSFGGVAASGGGFGGGGGGMGGMGGGMGGGMFSTGDPSPARQILRQMGGGAAQAQQPAGDHEVGKRRIDQLLKIIGNVVDGIDVENDCHVFGSSLVVRQTAEVQQQIFTLLEALHGANWNTRPVGLEATWFVLDSKVRPGADGRVSKGSAGAGAATKPLQGIRLGELARQRVAYHGQITCLNGQKVHFSTGRRRVVSSGATPTVGVAAIGYSPMTRIINIGAVLQVTPHISMDRQSAYVDLQSVVTQWNEPDPPIKIVSEHAAGSAEEKSVRGPIISDLATVDRLQIATQEWGTTVSIPVGTPVVVGSVSLTPPDGKQAELSSGDQPELGLMIEVRVPWWR